MSFSWLWFVIPAAALWAWWPRRSPKPTHPSPEDLIRPYPSHISTERILPLQGGVNFRDIGGYHTADGRTTRWGKIYRSGDLSQLTDDDLDYLATLNIKLICDLRTADEGAKSSNRLPPNALNHYRHIPIYEHPDHSFKWFLRLLFRRRQIEKLWIEEVYIKRFIEERAAVFGRILTLLAEEQHYPAVIHCTAGKDRTGLTIALLLALLNVPDQTIIADYTLSNRYYAQILATIESEAQRLAIFGINTPDLFPLLTAQEKVITRTLTHIRTRYGSIEHYLLTRARLSPDTIIRLRQNLLTD